MKTNFTDSIGEKKKRPGKAFQFHIINGVKTKTVSVTAAVSEEMYNAIAETAHKKGDSIQNFLCDALNSKLSQEVNQTFPTRRASVGRPRKASAP